MRPGQNKRMRGRPNNNNSGGHRRGPNPLTRSYESNGPDVKIRGNAHHVAEKYLQLARDAQSSGDPVAAESYLQHAEHYFRLIASAQQAQAGLSRQPDAVDTEGEDDDETGMPDRFASPQPATPFVQQPAPQPYVPDRPAYGGGERQPYNGERQATQGSEQRQPAERPYNGGERQAYGERNNYDRQQRQDRNGGHRRPYRDNVGGDARVDDRGAQDRGPNDRGPNAGYRNQDRRNGPDRNGPDRNYDRAERPHQDRPYRDPQAEAARDPYAGEQPRVEAIDRPAEMRPRVDAASPMDAPRMETSPQPSPRFDADPVPRTEAAPPARAPAASSDDGPGLPAFITTPTRVVPTPEPAGAEAISSMTFPGDGADEAPKFPRRRRRAVRVGADGANPSEGLPPTGD